MAATVGPEQAGMRAITTQSDCERRGTTSASTHLLPRPLPVCQQRTCGMRLWGRWPGAGSGGDQGAARLPHRPGRVVRFAKVRSRPIVNARGPDATTAGPPSACSPPPVVLWPAMIIAVVRIAFRSIDKAPGQRFASRARLVSHKGRPSAVPAEWEWSRHTPLEDRTHGRRNGDPGNSRGGWPGISQHGAPSGHPRTSQQTAPHSHSPDPDAPRQHAHRRLVAAPSRPVGAGSALFPVAPLQAGVLLLLLRSKEVPAPERACQRQVHERTTDLVQCRNCPSGCPTQG